MGDLSNQYTMNLVEQKKVQVDYFHHLKKTPSKQTKVN